MEPAYTYAATVVRWVDGDTVDLQVDVGFHMRFTGRFRLYGVNAPERGQAGHDEATVYVNDFAPAGSKVTVRTYAAPEKYGRFLADVQPRDTEQSINAMLVENGLAKPYFGGAK